MKLYYFLKREILYFYNKFNEHSTSSFAAQSAFYLMISLFPVMLLLIAIITLLPLDAMSAASFVEKFLPGETKTLITGIINETIKRTDVTLVSVSAVTLLWSASKGMHTIRMGLNSINEVKETRSFFKTRLASVLYTITFIILIVIALFVMVFGNKIGDTLAAQFPEMENFISVFFSLRYLVALFLFIFFFNLLYTRMPNRKSKIAYEFPGAVFSALCWLAFSAVYSYYIDRFGNFAFIYGSLTAVILLMLWLYSLIFILFLGAEINCRLGTRL